MKILINGSQLISHHLVPCLEAAGHVIASDLSISPDLILGLNELENSARLSMRAQIPMAIWFTDSHKAQSTAAPEFLKQNSFMFCFSEAQQQWFSKAGWQHTHYLPLAVDTGLFKPLTKKRRISFMGELRHMTSDSPMVQLLHPLRIKADPATVLGRELQFFFKELHNYLSQTAGNLNPVNRPELLQGLYQFCPEKLHKYIELFSPEQWQNALFENHNALQRAAVCRLFKNELDIYGTYDDWQTLGDWPRHLKKRASYPQEWADFCGESTISLNLFRPDPMHGIPLKAFEIAACSVLFTNDHPMLQTVFTPDENCIVFKTLEEARVKYQELIKSPERVADISRNSRELMIQRHQYTHRWEFMEKCFTTAELPAF